mmetsp:Transcript_118892/g.336293  ORF Transcript_118892/g.336293 Transcript_118892/m.336293 type:complete len:209 (-) Transcript_118892:225-851(-)
MGHVHQSAGAHRRPAATAVEREAACAVDTLRAAQVRVATSTGQWRGRAARCPCRRYAAVRRRQICGLPQARCGIPRTAGDAALPRRNSCSLSGVSGGRCRGPDVRSGAGGWPRSAACVRRAGWLRMGCWQHAAWLVFARVGLQRRGAVQSRSPRGGRRRRAGDHATSFRGLAQGSDAANEDRANQAAVRGGAGLSPGTGAAGSELELG